MEHANVSTAGPDADCPDPNEVTGMAVTSECRVGQDTGETIELVCLSGMVEILPLDLQMTDEDPVFDQQQVERVMTLRGEPRP